MNKTQTPQGQVSEQTGVALAAQRLVDRLDFIHAEERYKSVWLCAANHGMPYDGPTYEKELQSLRAALISSSEQTGAVKASFEGCPALMSHSELKKELERFRVAWRVGLAKDVEPISALAILQAEDLIAAAESYRNQKRESLISSPTQTATATLRKQKTSRAAKGMNK